jgi:hypothetical protein
MMPVNPYGMGVLLLRDIRQGIDLEDFLDDGGSHLGVLRFRQTEAEDMELILTLTPAADFPVSFLFRHAILLMSIPKI